MWDLCADLMMTTDGEDDDDTMIAAHVYLVFTMCQTLLHYSKYLYIYKLT